MADKDMTFADFDSSTSGVSIKDESDEKNPKDNLVSKYDKKD